MTFANVVYIRGRWYYHIFIWILTDVDVNVADGSHLNNMMADVDAKVVDEMANF